MRRIADLTRTSRHFPECANRGDISTKIHLAIWAKKSAILVELSKKCRRRMRVMPNAAVILGDIAKICRVKAKQLNPTLKLSIASHRKH
jgi:hypothetical protein